MFDVFEAQAHARRRAACSTYVNSIKYNLFPSQLHACHSYTVNTCIHTCTKLYMHTYVCHNYAQSQHIYMYATIMHKVNTSPCTCMPQLCTKSTHLHVPVWHNYAHSQHMYMYTEQQKLKQRIRQVRGLR